MALSSTHPLVLPSRETASPLRRAVRKLVRTLQAGREIFVEAQSLRREMLRRYPHLQGR